MQTARHHWSTAAAIGTLAAGTALARRDEVGPLERRVFRALNRGVGAGERPVWLVMQLGNGLAALAAPAILRMSGRSWRESAPVGVAAHGGWQLAKGVKAVVDRGRPAALLDDVALRDGDPTGRGFVSGHAAVATSVAVVAAPLLPPGVRPLLAAAAIVVAAARVHVGAHLPLDVVGGMALAAVWGRVVLDADAALTARGTR